jgi:signal transduction histidine kinase
MFNSPAEIFYSVIAGVGLMLFLVVIFVLSIVRYQNKTRKFREEKLLLRENFTKTLLQSRLEIQEQTLQNVSRELHDNLGQVASLIKINLNLLSLNAPPALNEQVQVNKELVGQLITDLKSISVSLNGDRIKELGLLKALQLEADRLNKAGVLKMTVTHSGYSQLPESNAVIIFRMLQELINNTLKYSQATELMVDIRAKETEIVVSVEDNGIGFDVEEKIKAGGSGLINLKNRAKLLAADLQLQSIVGKGTRTIIAFPNVPI